MLYYVLYLHRGTRAPEMSKFIGFETVLYVPERSQMLRLRSFYDKQMFRHTISCHRLEGGAYSIEYVFSYNIYICYII